MRKRSCWRGRATSSVQPLAISLAPGRDEEAEALALLLRVLLALDKVDTESEAESDGHAADTALYD